KNPATATPDRRPSKRLETRAPPTPRLPFFPAPSGLPAIRTTSCRFWGCGPARHETPPPPAPHRPPATVPRRGTPAPGSTRPAAHHTPAHPESPPRAATG